METYVEKALKMAQLYVRRMDPVVNEMMIKYIKEQLPKEIMKY